MIARIRPAVEEMSCARVAGFAKYLFKTDKFHVTFGQDEQTVAEACNIFPGLAAKAMAVSVPAGPPNNIEYRRLTIAQLVEDWLYWCVATKQNEVLFDFAQAVLWTAQPVEGP